MGHTHLTEAQERFCAEYWKCRNASHAYRLAYNAARAKPSTVHRRAAELLKNGKVAARISGMQDMADAQFGHMARRVIEELALVAFSDVGELVDEFGFFRNLRDLPRSVTAALAAVTVKATGGAPVVSFRLADKLRALALLIQILGIRESPDRDAEEFSSLTDAELDAELERLQTPSRTPQVLP